MISSLRNFAKTKVAGIFIFIIIIPFVFWGMGSVFSGGNTNNIAKINNKNVSTQDFMDYLNRSGLSQKVIKENIDKNILEELLSTLISSVLLDLEIKDLDLTLSEDEMVKRIKMNKEFLDENGKFKRTLYEKFLLKNNMTAAMYEMKLKSNVLQKQLFTYISSGAKSPDFFVEEYFTEKNSKLTVDFIDLNRFYKAKEKFSNEDLIKFINDNSDKLKQEHIDFSYIIISPKILTGSDEFDQTFFNKIDEIENQISKNVDFKSIANDLKISPTIKKDYINYLNENTIENTIENIIYNSRKNTTEIIEYDGAYILYNIDQINEKLASLNDKRFKDQISNVLFKKEKYEFNKKILDQINKKEFNQASFDKLGNNSIQNFKLESKDDDSKFEKNSVEILYSMPLNAFTLVSDYNDNIFVAKTVKYEEPSFSKNSKNYNAISNEASSENRNTILKSFDYLLNDKYKVVINEKTLERVKNYFR